MFYDSTERESACSEFSGHCESLLHILSYKLEGTLANRKFVLGAFDNAYHDSIVHTPIKGYEVSVHEWEMGSRDTDWEGSCSQSVERRTGS